MQKAKAQMVQGTANGFLFRLPREALLASGNQDNTINAEFTKGYQS